ncbi:MAG TPA: VOC family protein [Thermoleophilaceae bacterium]|jgi:catechol 2,3-dioxygenase-like lactoylglutathione lyase family enzyme|nr:VOC family protein [Thermoleophilaceae bacterium]
MQGGPLDHVALWTDEREALADFLCERAGMHVIDKTDTFTLVGADAKKGKITLFDADGPRERGALGHIGLNVHDESLAGNVSAPGGLELQFVDHRQGDDWDLNHVRLRVPDPVHAVSEFLQLGFEPGDGPESVVAGDKTIYFVEGGDGRVERPLLNHIALLVDSHKEHADAARERGLEYEEVDAANTWAVFVTGPYGIRIEYVEHKPGFALK